jgi:hypothetical protein
MAHYIFLKSLRSPEEFMKIPISKFLLNLLLQISKAFVYSKKQFLFKNNSPQISAQRPASPVLARFAPQATVHALGPFGLSSLGVFAKRRLFFRFAQSGNDAFSLSCHCHVSPAHQFHPFPRAG